MRYAIECYADYQLEGTTMDIVAGNTRRKVFPIMQQHFGGGLNLSRVLRELELHLHRETRPTIVMALRGPR